MNRIIISVVVGAITFAIAMPASFQVRVQLPGGYRVPTGMICPIVRGASQLGWEIYHGIQQYGRAGDRGRWPGIGPAHGLW